MRLSSHDAASFEQFAKGCESAAANDSRWTHLRIELSSGCDARSYEACKVDPLLGPKCPCRILEPTLAKRLRYICPFARRPLASSFGLICTETGFASIA